MIKRRRFGPILLVMGILSGTCAWAQTDTGTTPDTTAPTQPGPQPAYTYPDTRPSLDFLNQSIENSSITLGIATGFTFDSQAYANSNASHDYWLFHVTPSIRIQQFLPKLSWNFSYSGGYQTYTSINGPPNSANSNLFSQNAGAGFIWQMTQHWQLRANDSFRYSANPFDSYLTTPGLPTINNPNPVVYTPLTQFTQNNALMTLTNQLTKTDTLSFTGTSDLRRTTRYNLVSSVPFYNLISYGGRANYSHRLNPRLGLGAGYIFNSLDFGKGQQRSGTQTIMATVDYLLRPNMTISGWVGPEYTGTQDTIFGIKLPHTSMWNTSAGVNFGWRGLRDSVTAGFTRSVSDGGGIIGTSEVDHFNVSYRRMITRKMDAVLGGQFLHDVSTATTTTVPSRNFNNTYIDLALSYAFMKSLRASATYAHTHQSQSSTIVIGSSSYNANIVGVTVSYSWDHPLGR